MPSVRSFPVSCSIFTRCATSFSTLSVKASMTSWPVTRGLNASGAVWIDGVAKAGQTSARMSANCFRSDELQHVVREGVDDVLAGHARLERERRRLDRRRGEGGADIGEDVRNLLQIGRASARCP